MNEKLQHRLHLASTLGVVGSILAIITSTLATLGSLITILVGSVISSATLGAWLEPVLKSPYYTDQLDSMMILQNLDFLKGGIVISGIIVFILGLLFIFFSVKMLHFSREYRTDLNHQHAIYMIVFSVFLIFSGRPLCGALLLTSGILAYTVKEQLLET
ncbi:MAG: hypothetical protein ACRCWD_01290 [Culicoidibacterales bacterium]